MTRLNDEISDFIKKREEKSANMTLRQKRVSVLMMRELSNLISRKSPCDDIIGISSVRISADMKNATVFVNCSQCNSENDRERICGILESMKRYLVSSLKKNLRMKIIPNLKFKYDEFMVF